MFEGESSDIPPEPAPSEEQPPEAERTIEEIGNELVGRLDALDTHLAEIDARLSTIETRNGEPDARYAAREHNHEPAAPAEETPGETPPAPVHRWFRKIGE